VDIPAEVSDEGAAAIVAAVTERLKDWATDAEGQLWRDLGVRVSLRATDPFGL
jgi:hypothetical protein